MSGFHDRMSYRSWGDSVTKFNNIKGLNWYQQNESAFADECKRHAYFAFTYFHYYYNLYTLMCCIMDDE